MQESRERGILELPFLAGEFPSNSSTWKCCCTQEQCAGMHGIFGTFPVGMCGRQEPIGGGQDDCIHTNDIKSGLG